MGRWGKRTATLGALATTVAFTGCIQTGAAAGPGPSEGASPAARSAAIKAGRVVMAADGSRYIAPVEGDSMKPIYDEGCVVVIADIAFRDLEPGMVVAYRDRRGDQILHRIHRREADGWVARGDNNPNDDTERVTADNLLGYVYAVMYPPPE